MSDTVLIVVGALVPLGALAMALLAGRARPEGPDAAPRDAPADCDARGAAVEGDRL